MATRLRAGVVGLRMGMNQAAAYCESRDADLAAVCDLLPGKLEEAEKKFDVPLTYQKFEDMIAEADLDMVSICLPNVWHEPYSVAALEAGIHTLCTKPIAIDLAAALRMKEAADRSGKILMVGHQLPMTSMSKRAKEVIQSGRLGEIYFIRTSRFRKTCNLGPSFFSMKNAGGGPMLDLGVHTLDFVLHLLDDPKAVTVSGFMSNRLLQARSPEFDVEDLACAFIKLETGALFSLETSFMLHVIKQEPRAVSIYGTDAALHVTPGSKKPLVLSSQDTDESGEAIAVPAEPHAGQAISVHHFVECVRDGKPPINTPERGVHVMRVIDAFYRSAREGREVTVNWD